MTNNNDNDTSSCPCGSGWLGLKIINTVDGNIDDKTGEVEFVARSKINGKASRLHENSQFARFENRWVYTKGKLSNK